MPLSSLQAVTGRQVLAPPRRPVMSSVIALKARISADTNNNGGVSLDVKYADRMIVRRILPGAACARVSPRVWCLTSPGDRVCSLSAR